MNIDELAKKWRRLDAIPFKEISTSRKFAHEAIQFLANASLSYIQKREDDSHTNCEWSRSLKALVGNVMGEKNKICLGLNISDFKLLLLKENWTIVTEFFLKDKDLNDVLKWLKNNFENQDLDANQFTLEKHYEIPVNTVLDGGQFLIENKMAYQELSDYFSNADLIIRAYISDLTNATPVRCWPHHLDIATLLNIGQENLQSIGIGLSPGDSSNQEPYFYVTLWPYPDLNQVKFPELLIGGWNKTGWIGACLSASEIINKTNEEDQYKMAYNFIESAVQKIKETLL